MSLIVNWRRPFEEVAKLCAERIAVRHAGFTDAALAFPRSHQGLIAICAFNGVDPDVAPRGWHYWPNEATKCAWERVIAAIEAAQ